MWRWKSPTPTVVLAKAAPFLRESAIAFCNCEWPLTDRGAPWPGKAGRRPVSPEQGRNWTYPEPVLALPLVAFIAGKAPNPNAAKVFIEYLFSLPSLATYVSQGGLPDRKGVPDNRKIRSEPWFSPPDTSKLWSYTTEDILTTFPEVAKAWNSIFKK